MDVLGLLEGLQALAAELAAEARLLEAAEGPGVVVGQGVVEPDRAGLDLAHAAKDVLQVPGVDVRAQAELCPVRELDRLVERLDGDDGRNGSERLLAKEVRLGSEPGYDGRREEVPALMPGPVAARQDLGAGRNGGLDLCDDLLALDRGDHRADVGCPIGRVADHERVRVLDERGDVVVVDVLHDVEALGRRAHLSRVQVRRPGAAARGHLDLGGDVRADDEGVLAAHLQVHARHAVDARGRHLLARFDRAGERDRVDVPMRRDRAADVARAGHDVHRSGRQVVEDAGDREGRERRHLRGLADSGVAGGQSRSQLPGQEEQGVVPRHDAPDDSKRVLHHQGELRGLDGRDHPAGRVTADLGVVVERGRDPADLVGVLDHGLATLRRHQRRELVGPLAERPRDLVKHVRALCGRGRLPCPEGTAGSCDRGIDLF